MVEASLVNLAELGVLIVGVVIALRQLNDIKETRKIELETRQASLFMQLYNKWSDPEFAKHYGIARYKYTQGMLELLPKMIDPYDPDIHIPFHSLGQFFEGMGMLVKKKLIDIEYVDELLSYRIVWWWERTKPVYERERKLMNNPDLYSNIEYLYNEIIKRGYKAQPLIQVVDIDE
jgi:hypothetical protein